MNTVEQTILELLSDETTGINKGIDPGDPLRIKTFYQGEVVLVPKSYLPALMVWGTKTEQTAKSTAKDMVKYDISIRVVIDVLSEFTEENSSGIIQSQKTLRLLMEERDTAGIAKDTSVMGILRRNIRTTAFLFTDKIVVTYRTLQKGEFFYVQADLEMQATSDLVLRE